MDGIRPKNSVPKNTPLESKVSTNSFSANSPSVGYQEKLNKESKRVVASGINNRAYSAKTSLPNRVREEEDLDENFYDPKKVEQNRVSFDQRRPSFEQKKSSNRKIGYVLLSILLALVVDYFILNQLQNATIKITPYRKFATIQEPITAYKNAGKDKLEFSIIAVTEKVEKELVTDTTELIETYAQGKVKLFNNYSTEPERLLPGTRLRALNGSEFVIQDKEIIVPGRVDQTPGELVVSVQAVGPGADYNISPTDFSVPEFYNQGLEEKYTQIYGLSLEAFTGGAQQQAPSVSLEKKELEIQQLKEELTVKLQDLLFAEKTPEMYLIQKTPVIEFHESNFSANSDSAGTLSLSGTIYALLLDRDELGNYLANTYLDLQEGSRATLSPINSLSPRILVAAEKLDFNNLESVQFVIDQEMLFTWEVDRDQVLEVFKGVPVTEVPRLVDTTQWIGEMKLKLNPRWSKLLPSNEEKITIHFE
jgi:hypothetical protein